MVRREGGKQKSAVPLPAAAMSECLLIRVIRSSILVVFALHPTFCLLCQNLPPILLTQIRLHHLRVEEEETGVQHAALNASFGSESSVLSVCGFPLVNFFTLRPKSQRTSIEGRPFAQFPFLKCRVAESLLSSASRRRSHTVRVCR